MLGLGVMITMLGAFTLTGCYISRPVDQATASDVNNRSFTFASGVVFHSALVNVSTTLSFTDNAASFTLSSAGGTATGTNRFDSCILTVTTSTYKATAGPQEGEVIPLDPCDFHSDNETLTVSRGDITAISSVATPFVPGSDGNVQQATASDVDNRSFTFANGGVFHTALTNVQTALEFTNDAQNFTLTSAGAVKGTASGTNRFGSCILTVTTSTYSTGRGPQEGEVITLQPCNFNSTNHRLTVTNGSITATSEPATL
jgi:predicted small secreted protein